jgi:MFS family permease
MSRTFSFMRGNVLVMTVCSALWRVSTDIMWPFLSLYVLALGGDYETIGMVMAVGNLAGMIFYPLGGYLADYQGRIRVMSYMTYIYALTFLIFVFTSSWEWVAVGMFMQSLVTFYTPAMQALMADSLPPEKRGLGFATTMAIPAAVGIASPVIGGLLIDMYGIGTSMHALYALGFFVGLVVATLRLKFLRETVESSDRIDVSLGKIPRMWAGSFKDVLQTMKEAPRRLLTLSLLVSACIFFISMVNPFWIVSAQERIGVTTKEWGTLMLINGAINVALAIPAGSLVDRLSKKWVAGACLILGAIPVFLFLRTTTFVDVLLVGVFATLTNTFLNPAIQTLFANSTPREKRGRIMASIGGGGMWLMGGAWGSGVLTMLSLTAGSLSSGYVYNYDPFTPWYVLSAALIVLGVLFILLVEEPMEAEI